MNTKWCIVADDFTGASDSAVQFGSIGNTVRLVLGGLDSISKEIRKKTNVVVVNTDTRFTTAKDAYQTVLETTQILRSARHFQFFKKIDSTLRGNIADETAAVMDAAGYRFALVAPAAPRNNRTVVDGHCMVDGTVVTLTTAGKDPFTPVTDGRVASLFTSRFPGAVQEIHLDRIRAQPSELKASIENGLDQGQRIFILDAEHMQDLDAIASLRSISGCLFVGASGLAEALARYCASTLPPRPRTAPGRIAFIIGSLTPTSATQCRLLAASPDVAELVCDSAAAMQAPLPEIARLVSLAVNIPSTMALLVRTDGFDKPADAIPVLKEHGTAFSRFLGELTVALARTRRLRFVLASGGDCAARIASSFGADSVQLLNEIIPGLPFGYFHSPVLGRRLYFVSKSGGFGPPPALVEVLGLITSSSAHQKEHLQ